MAKLLGIATHTESKGKIDTHQEITVSLEAGLENDYQGQKNRKTQVTLLSLQDWQKACQQCDSVIDWTERRANLLVDDFEFSESMVGRQIQVGQVLLEITKETDPCSRMEALQAGLQAALTPNWRGGARCKVLRAGHIKIGDSITLLKRY